MKYLALFIFKFLSYLDKIIYLFFKKNYIYFFSDIINQNLNVKKKIDNKTINFFAPKEE